MNILETEPYRTELASLMQELDVTPMTPPDLLYHYTTADGIIKILSSNCIWASHASYLNDSSELLYASSLIRQVLDTKKQHVKSDITSMFLSFLDTIALKLEAGNLHFYALCFCENGDLLSQWRAYGDKGGGYAVGIDFSHGAQLYVPKLGHFFILQKVIYDSKEQERLINQVVDRACSTLDKFNHKIDSVEVPEVVALCASVVRIKLSSFICTFKHPTFAEEKEWRLINTPLADGYYEPALSFRSVNGMLVPYFELGMLDGTGHFTNLPIAEIICGPTLHPQLSKQSVELLLKKYGYYDVKVLGSDIPLRA